ncbi:hypothetical protein PQ455_01555 [Sphingomonas naphthae]|uniref:XRE family transcriptional regulator n=1 Tax=Sphingomonas naphthae TaxID=1813468 RepID=A0ABY7TMG0_9SPHN|nr:hypothetical protein [Sphingomonas naphthae]WCT73946.1 hypothetical protein PQ455_01555 [Sphingomonas naphthae]
MLMPPEQIDQKFTQAGWSIDPHVCPDCRASRTKEKPMASKPSPAAMKAQVQMIGLLSEHFDTDAGAYAVGWSDKKIADETGVSPATVAEFRLAGFGEIKEPAAICALRADINALDQLSREHQAIVQSEIASLRSKLAQVSAKVVA